MHLTSLSRKPSQWDYFVQKKKKILHKFPGTFYNNPILAGRCDFLGLIFLMIVVMITPARGLCKLETPQRDDLNIRRQRDRLWTESMLLM